MYTRTSWTVQGLLPDPSVINSTLTRYTVFPEESYWMTRLYLVLLRLDPISNLFIVLVSAFSTPLSLAPFNKVVPDQDYGCTYQNKVSAQARISLTTSVDRLMAET